MKKTPEGCWPSNTIDEIVDAVLAAAKTQALIVSVGIDPGISGALGLLARVPAGPFVAGGVLDLPTMPDPGSEKEGREAIDLQELARWLLRVPEGSHFTIERFLNIPAGFRARGATSREQADKIARAMMSNNVRLSGTTGELRGVVNTAAVVRRFRVLSYPTPTQWRKAVRAPADKEEARQFALRLFPWLQHRLSAKAHHNRAEALLLACHGTEVST